MNGPHTRALLDRARNADDAEMNRARDRVRGALGRKLGVAAVGIAATTASTAGAGTTASVGMGLLAKTAIGLAALSITAGGIAVARHESKPKPLPPAVTIAAPRVALPPVAETTPTPIATAVAATPTPIPIATPMPIATTVAVTPTPIATSTPIAAVAPSPAPSISEELTALRKANDALIANRPSEALVILDTAPSSATLSEERTALRLLANCALGSSNDAVKAFLAAHPSSPLAARLKSTCSIP